MTKDEKQSLKGIVILLCVIVLGTYLWVDYKNAEDVRSYAYMIERVRKSKDAGHKPVGESPAWVLNAYGQPDRYYGTTYDYESYTSDQLDPCRPDLWVGREYYWIYEHPRGMPGTMVVYFDKTKEGQWVASSARIDIR